MFWSIFSSTSIMVFIYLLDIGISILFSNSAGFFLSFYFNDPVPIMTSVLCNPHQFYSMLQEVSWACCSAEWKHLTMKDEMMK